MRCGAFRGGFLARYADGDEVAQCEAQDGPAPAAEVACAAATTCGSSFLYGALALGPQVRFESVAFSDAASEALRKTLALELAYALNLRSGRILEVNVFSAGDFESAGHLAFSDRGFVADKYGVPGATRSPANTDACAWKYPPPMAGCGASDGNDDDSGNDVKSSSNSALALGSVANLVGAGDDDAGSFDDDDWWGASASANGNENGNGNGNGGSGGNSGDWTLSGGTPALPGVALSASSQVVVLFRVAAEEAGRGEQPLAIVSVQLQQQILQGSSRLRTAGTYLRHVAPLSLRLAGGGLRDPQRRADKGWSLLQYALRWLGLAGLVLCGLSFLGFRLSRAKTARARGALRVRVCGVEGQRGGSGVCGGGGGGVQGGGGVGGAEGVEMVSLPSRRPVVRGSALDGDGGGGGSDGDDGDDRIDDKASRNRRRDDAGPAPAEYSYGGDWRPEDDEVEYEDDEVEEEEADNEGSDGGGDSPDEEDLRRRRGPRRPQRRGTQADFHHHHQQQQQRRWWRLGWWSRWGATPQASSSSSQRHGRRSSGPGGAFPSTGAAREVELMPGAATSPALTHRRAGDALGQLLGAAGGAVAGAAGGVGAAGGLFKGHRVDLRDLGSLTPAKAEI